MKNNLKKVAKSNKSEAAGAFDFVKLLAQMQKDIQNIRETIPSEVNLTSEQRKSLAQVGIARWAFVETGLQMAVDHPHLLPKGDTVEKITQLQEVFHMIKEVNQTLELLNHSFSDLKTLKTNQCLKIAAHVYQIAKIESHNKTDDALSIYQQLKGMRPKRKKKNKIELNFGE